LAVHSAASPNDGIDLDPFIEALHIAFFAGGVVSLIGAEVSLLRGPHQEWVSETETGPGSEVAA
jgi:hypothetical protein